MVLGVFAGLPGVGKSTLAERVAAALPATVLSVDTVDAALRRYDVAEPRPGYAAYGVVLGLAETQLRVGGSVLIDAANPVGATRQLWVDLAERLSVPLRVVEVVCGDETEHRRRAADWEHVLRRTSEYEPYVGARLVVDTHLAAEPVPAVLAYLS
jgi:predicted kinase